LFIYSRMRMNGLDLLGSMVDEMFLAPGRFIAWLQARRKTDWPAFAREIAFYHEQGFVKNPSSFFVLPDQAPEFVVEKQASYRKGFYQVITFPSRYEPRNPFLRKRYLNHPENRTGYLIRWIHGDKPRKTVLCVHGFMMGDPREAEQMFKVRKLFSMGLDVALFIYPFHWKRIAGPRASRRIYLTLGDAAFTNECIAHSIHDLHNSFLILHQLGVQDIGLVGASLGGYVTGLYVCLSSLPEFAALMVPAVTFLQPISPALFYNQAPYGPQWRKQVYHAADFHSPLHFYPKIPVEEILVVASRGDRICPAAPVEQLRIKWGLSRCHYRTGGHWLVFDKVRGRVWYGLLRDMGFIA